MLHYLFRFSIGIIRILIVVAMLAILIKISFVLGPFGKNSNLSKDVGNDEDKNDPEIVAVKVNTSEKPVEREEKGTASAQTEVQKVADVKEGSAEPGVNKKFSYDRKPEVLFMTYEEVISITNISFWDKLEGLNIIRKLKKEDVERILRIADGGITMGERDKLNEILVQELSEKDVNKLNEILAKNKKLYSATAMNN